MSLYVSQKHVFANKCPKHLIKEPCKRFTKRPTIYLYILKVARSFIVFGLELVTLRREFDWQASWPVITLNLPFLSNKQTRQESTLMLVYLSLKLCVLTSFQGWKKIPSGVHSCLFHAISSKKLLVHMPLNWGATVICNDTFKSHKTEFFDWATINKKMATFKSWHFVSYLNSYPVSLLFGPQCSFHCVRKWCVAWKQHGLLDIATIMKGQGLCEGSVFLL